MSRSFSPHATWQSLMQRRFDRDTLGARRRQWHEVSLDRRAIHFEANLVAVSGTLHFDLIRHAAEFAAGLEAAPAFRNNRRDQQALEGRADAQNPLRDGVVVPRGRAGQPRVLGFSIGGSIAPGDHLRINVRLATVDIADLFARRWINPRVIVVRGIPISDARFANDDPGVVVAKDTGVFLVARGV